MVIIGHINMDQAERDGMVKDAPLWWQKQGLQETATGYGGKLTSTRMVKWLGRWRRVYVACYSNNGTAYITHGKDWIVCS
jgi:hypothetical protein